MVARAAKKIRAEDGDHLYIDAALQTIDRLQDLGDYQLAVPRGQLVHSVGDPPRLHDVALEIDRPRRGRNPQNADDAYAPPINADKRR